MKWNSSHLTGLRWSGPITHEKEKEEVAQRIAALVSNGDVIGLGSGSTAFLAIQAIGSRLKREGISCTVIPTSIEMAMAAVAVGVPVTTLLQAKPDWSFDGADEVDPAHNLLKGRGGALFQEKILMASSLRNYILVDKSKLVSQLGSHFPIPVEVHPLALNLVEEGLVALGATEVTLRLAQGKDGPVITENGNLLLDARFPRVVETLEKQIKSITGVIESGLFIGYKVEIMVAGEENV